ncbi:hypothetical protein [Helicobacter pylori]|uniref:hypothetical protein n=1 Tax=Helicobacter pylori TaxID=210 RepID=UPI0039E014FF
MAVAWLERGGLRFFLLKCVRKIRQETKMKNIYFNVEKSIKDLQKIFENTDGADEGLRKFNQKALELFKN